MSMVEGDKAPGKGTGSHAEAGDEGTQDSRVAALEASVAALEARVAALESPAPTV
jgi:uncharacterized protein YceH (UPF0502 family)